MWLGRGDTRMHIQQLNTWLPKGQRVLDVQLRQTQRFRVERGEDQFVQTAPKGGTHDALADGRAEDHPDCLPDLLVVGDERDAATPRWAWRERPARADKFAVAH